MIQAIALLRERAAEAIVAGDDTTARALLPVITELERIARGDTGSQPQQRANAPPETPAASVFESEVRRGLMKLGVPAREAGLLAAKAINGIDPLDPKRYALAIAHALEGR